MFHTNTKSKIENEFQEYLISINKNRKMKNITINLPDTFLDFINALRKNAVFFNRSEIIRFALFRFLKKELALKKMLDKNNYEEIIQSLIIMGEVGEDT